MQHYTAFQTLQLLSLFTQKNENQKLTRGTTPSPTAVVIFAFVWVCYFICLAETVTRTGNMF